MRVKLRPFVICVALVAGCRSWDVRVLGASLAPEEPPRAAPTEPDRSSIWLVIALVAADVAMGVLIHEARN